MCTNCECKSVGDAPRSEAGEAQRAAKWMPYVYLGVVEGSVPLAMVKPDPQGAWVEAACYDKLASRTRELESQVAELTRELKELQADKSSDERQSPLARALLHEFKDEDYRYGYADSQLDTYIATQIKILREQRGLTQADLAAKCGMAQPRIAALEDCNYSAWSVRTLRRLARTLGVRLSVKFEDFPSLIEEIEKFSAATLVRDSFSGELKEAREQGHE